MRRRAAFPFAYATSRPLGEIAASTCRPSSMVHGEEMPSDPGTLGRDDTQPTTAMAPRPATTNRGKAHRRGPFPVPGIASTIGTGVLIAAETGDSVNAGASMTAGVLLSA